MTSHRIRRCSHCGNTYPCLRSGHGHDELHDNSDAKYCLPCSKVAKGALKAAFREVPVLFRREWLDASKTPYDVTVDDCLKWHEAEMADVERKRSEGAVIGVRVAMPLFDTEDPENRNEAFFISVPEGIYKGLRLLVSHWTKTPENDTICVDVEYDVQNEKVVGPWKEYHS